MHLDKMSYDEPCAYELGIFANKSITMQCELAVFKNKMKTRDPLGVAITIPNLLFNVFYTFDC